MGLNPIRNWTALEPQIDSATQLNFFRIGSAVLFSSVFCSSGAPLERLPCLYLTAACQQVQPHNLTSGAATLFSCVFCSSGAPLERLPSPYLTTACQQVKPRSYKQHCKCLNGNEGAVSYFKMLKFRRRVWRKPKTSSWSFAGSRTECPMMRYRVRYVQKKVRSSSVGDQATSRLVLLLSQVNREATAVDVEPKTSLLWR
jgi:hypothetical protein